MATQKQILDQQISIHGLIAEVGKDKYGRSTCTYTRRIYGEDKKFVASYASPVVKMPKSYTEKYPEQQYLVNDWSVRPSQFGSTDASRGVTYHSTRFAAHQQAIANVVAAEISAALQSA